MTFLRSFYVLTPFFSLLACVMLRTYKYTTLNLHGNCFLSVLYNDIIYLTSTQSTLVFVSSDSSSHTYATSRSSSLRTDRHTAVFACATNTHDTAFGNAFRMVMSVR